MIPFIGTALGAACVFVMRRRPSPAVHKILNGFAAGIMVAASVWSLLIPAMEQAVTMGQLQFIPAVTGFWVGILFLLVLDRIIPHLRGKNNCSKERLSNTSMMALAVTLHNIPEGMAVGVLFAGVMRGIDITMAEATALSLGIAIQNFPEGAIISMPLHADGMGKGSSFVWGALSGIVEPVAAVVTILVSWLIVPLLPYMLSFAAGAMIYVIIAELIPEMSEGLHTDAGTVAFALGFTLMLAMDVALG